jgi:hypothetical protein
LVLTLVNNDAKLLLPLPLHGLYDGWDGHLRHLDLNVDSVGVLSFIPQGLIEKLGNYWLDSKLRQEVVANQVGREEGCQVASGQGTYGIHEGLAVGGLSIVQCPRQSDEYLNQMIRQLSLGGNF